MKVVIKKVNCRILLKFLEINRLKSLNLVEVGHIYLKNLEASKPGSTNLYFETMRESCLDKVFLGPSLKDRKSLFFHAAAKKCCGSGNLIIYNA